FFRAFCMANHLSCMLTTGTIPEILHQFNDLVDNAFSGEYLDAQYPNTFADNSEPILEADEKKITLLPATLYRTFLRFIQADPTMHHSTDYCSAYDDTPAENVMVLNAHVQFLLHVDHRGRRFAAASYCEADSHVIYRSCDGQDLVLGQIKKLFVHKRRCTDGQIHHQVFAVIRQYLGLTTADAIHDPYRRYIGLRASLVYDSPSRENEIVAMRNITAHFVACPYDDGGVLSRPCMVALPLDQVRRNIVDDRCRLVMSTIHRCSAT
ncbi:hypothetical protein L226DRAFT_474091, partial [Lentinus tigrinus ALCF2SS1-7]